MKGALGLLWLLLASACFDPRLSDIDASPGSTTGGTSGPSNGREPDGSANMDADVIDGPDLDAGTNGAGEGGAEASAPYRHPQCNSPRPQVLPTLTDATPWFASTPVTACDETPLPVPCSARDACPFEGRCVHVDGIGSGVCVQGEGTLPLVFRDGTCVTWVDETTRASLCCAGLGGLDCETSPRATKGEPGALCGRHDDCADGLVCKADDTIGRCLCPEMDLTDLASSSSCEGAAAPRTWGVAPAYEPQHTCLPGPEPDMSIDVLFDRVVEDDYQATFDALVDAEVVGDALHIAYAGPDGVVMHLVMRDGKVEPVAVKRLPWRQGGGVVPAEIRDVDLAVDALAPGGSKAHLAIATNTGAGVVYWSGDTFVDVGVRANDVALGFVDSLPTDYASLRTAVLAFPEGEGVQVLALKGERFEPAYRFDFEPYGWQGYNALAITTGTGGDLQVLLSKMADEQTPGTTWFDERINGQTSQLQLNACRAPALAGGWFACDDGAGAMWLGAVRSDEPTRNLPVRKTDAFVLENTLPVLRQPANDLVYLAHRTPDGLEARKLGYDETSHLLTRDRTTTRAVVLPVPGFTASVLYATTTAASHHHQLRLAHPGPCLLPDRVLPTAPEPPAVVPVTHPSCSTPLTYEFSDPYVNRDASGRPLMAGISHARCDGLSALRTCDPNEPCFAGEVCLETTTEGRSVCVRDALLSDEQCHLPSREDPNRQGVLGVTNGGQCLRCFSPESKRAACCAGVVGLDCREMPDSAPGGVGRMCAQQSECEPGLICGAAGPANLCSCPEYGYGPSNDGALCNPPMHAAWPQGRVSKLALEECIASPTPGWSIECAAEVKGRGDDGLNGVFAAAPDGSVWMALGRSFGVSLAHLSGGKWTRQVLSESASTDASIAVDAQGTVYVVAVGYSQSSVMSNESGAFKSWTAAPTLTLTVGDTFVDADGVLHVMSDYHGYGYLRIDRDQVVPWLVLTDPSTDIWGLDLRPRLARDTAGDLYLYRSRDGGKIAGNSWLAETLPLMVDAAAGPQGVVRVEESAPHGFRIVTAENVEEAWQNPDPYFDAGATEPSLAIASDGTVWVAHLAPTGMRVTTNESGSFQSELLVGAQVQHEMVLDANDEPHVFYWAWGDGEVDYLHHAFRGACPAKGP